VTARHLNYLCAWKLTCGEHTAGKTKKIKDVMSQVVLNFGSWNKYAATAPTIPPEYQSCDEQS
jgi:hypothetical protein